MGDLGHAPRPENAPQRPPGTRGGHVHQRREAPKSLSICVKRIICANKASPVAAGRARRKPGKGAAAVPRARRAPAKAGPAGGARAGRAHVRAPAHQSNNLSRGEPNQRRASEGKRGGGPRQRPQARPRQRGQTRNGPPLRSYARNPEQKRGVVIQWGGYPNPVPRVARNQTQRGRTSGPANDPARDGHRTWREARPEPGQKRGAGLTAPQRPGPAPERRERGRTKDGRAGGARGPEGRATIEDRPQAAAQGQGAETERAQFTASAPKSARPRQHNGVGGASLFPRPTSRQPHTSRGASEDSRSARQPMPADITQARAGGASGRRCRADHEPRKRASPGAWCRGRERSPRISDDTCTRASVLLQYPYT